MHDIDDDERVQLMSSRKKKIGELIPGILYINILKDEIVHAQFFCPIGMPDATPHRQPLVTQALH